MNAEQQELFEQPTDPPPSVRALIERYINGRRDEKLETAKTDDERQKLMDKYQYDAWIADASHRIGQIRLASHTAKHHHPASKASSVYASQALPSAHQHQLLGSADLPLEPDVVGNAAALDIFKMLRLEHDGENLLSRLLRGDPALQAALSHQPDQATLLMEKFQQFAQMPSKLVAGRTAKQVYVPVTQGYHLLVVLYPSSLVHRTWQQISHDRFSEHAKALRDARKKGEPSDLESREYKNVLVHRYGGTKPQNISQLNSDRRGSMWLLPSLPPTWSSQSVYLPKSNFFGSSLRAQPEIKAALGSLIHWYKQAYQPNNLPFRDERDRRLAMVVDAVLDVALSIQSQAPIGWTQECSLSAAQKIWLDRQYLEPLELTETPEQQALLTLMRSEEWQQQIAKDFGGWLNSQLGKVIDDLDDAEKRVWAVYYFADNLNAMWGEAA